MTQTIDSRNVPLQIVLTLATLGLYGVYWKYRVSKDMYDLELYDQSPGWDVVLSSLPLVRMWRSWQWAEAAYVASNHRASVSMYYYLSGYLLDVLLLPFVQLGLNERARS